MSQYWPAPFLPSYSHINHTGILFHPLLEFCFCTPPPCPTLENKSWSLHPGSFQYSCGEKIFRVKKRIAFSDGEFQILSVIGVQTNQVSHVPGSLGGTVVFGIFLNFSSKWLLGIFFTPTRGLKGGCYHFCLIIRLRRIRAKVYILPWCFSREDNIILQHIFWVTLAVLTQIHIRKLYME